MVLPGRVLYIRRKMVVGRLTKEMKKAELMEQLTEANEAYLEKISQHMECQYREMQRVERRIERKKKLIDKKYMVSIKKLAKERKEKLKKIVGRYRRIEEKVREATIDKVDLAEIENIEKEYITLRQFLLNICAYHSGKNAWIKSKIAVLCEGESLSQVVKRDFCSSVKW